MLSFIIPAHNEEHFLGPTLDSIQTAAQAVGEPFETIVVDDASTDRTAEIAATRGAHVVRSERRQIAAARNAGAAQAQGEILIFVDADTLLPEATRREVLAAVRAGAVGGGAWLRFDKGGSAAIRALSAVFAWVWFGVCRWAAGCFVFVRRDAFAAAGGFDERYFASEELHLSRALKRQGRFAIVRSPVVTSARKLRAFSAWAILGQALRVLARGPGSLRRREALDLWYGDRLLSGPKNSGKKELG